MTTAALALAILVQTVAVGEPGMVWGYVAPSHPRDLGRLFFGVPDTENALLTVDCRPGSRRVTLNTFADAAPRSGLATVRAGAAVATVRSKVEDNDIADGFFVETRLATANPVIRAFRQGARLEIRAGDAITRPPKLDPAAGEPFFKLCGG